MPGGLSLPWILLINDEDPPCPPKCHAITQRSLPSCWAAKTIAGRQQGKDLLKRQSDEEARGKPQIQLPEGRARVT